LKSTLPVLLLSSVIPAQAGIQFLLVPCLRSGSVLDSRIHGNDNGDAIWSASSQSHEEYVTKGGRPFRKIFTSPEGEGFPPSPMVTLKSHPTSHDQRKEDKGDVKSASFNLSSPEWFGERRNPRLSAVLIGTAVAFWVEFFGLNPLDKNF
jgi:hypothetical protein